MGEDSDDSVSSPEDAKRRLADLVARRDQAEAERRDLTDQIRAALRQAHDFGLSWSELAEVAGYRSAEAARVQALRRDDRPPDDVPPHPEGSYSIREAADILGVTTQSIYDWIKSGRIQIAVDRARGRRVFLPEHSAPSD